MSKYKAIDEARRRSKSRTPTSEPGYCLREVRECYGVGAKAPDAIAAWNAAQHKHPETDPRKIPRGAPVFWSGGSGGHGHIAIKAGAANVWSTDIKRPGYFDKVPADLIRQRWGLKLLGWTEDVNGVRVYPPKEGK